MSAIVRYFFDNHLPKAVLKELLKRGLDVITAHQSGRTRSPDEELLRLAMIEGRVVVTQDDDFKILAADFVNRGENFAGIVFCDRAKYRRRPGLMIQDLLILHGVYTADDMLNRLEYL